MMPLTTVMSRDPVDAITLAEIAETCHVFPDQIEDIYACTPLQVSSIAESSIYAGDSVYRLVINIAPTVDLDLFCAALQRVASLNSVLRTRIVDCDLGVVQVVTSEQHYTKRLSGDAAQYIREDKAHPIGLGDQLFRSAIIARKLVLTMHHAILDFTSSFLMIGDVIRIYHGQEPKVHAAFKDFVAHCISIEESTARTFWASQFKGTPAIFPHVELGYIPHATQTLSRDLEFRQVSAGVSLAHLPSFIEAAWALTLGVYTNSQNVVYGRTLSGRTPALGGAETTLGPTLAIVPVQVKLQHNMTVEGILKERTTANRQLQTHPALQYGIARIRTVSEAAQIASGFQTLLNIYPPPLIDASESADLEHEQTDEPHAPFSLCMICLIANQRISVKAMFDPNVIGEPQLRRVLQQFEYYLQALMEADLQMKLGKLVPLNPYDRSEILQWNITVPDIVENCLHELFSAEAQRQPAAVAIEACDGSATYGQLDDMSSRLAQELRRKGVSTECPVAFIFEKSIWTIVAVLAIMKAGGACVPINRSDPHARKAALISGANIKIILVSSTELANSIGLAPEIFVVTEASISGLLDINVTLDNRTGSAENLAYIIFTSGSTGIPKGVMLEHRCLASSLYSVAQPFGWREPGCRMLQFATHVWDASIGEIFGAILFGGCLCIPSEEARGTRLVEFIQSSKVNSAWLTPTVLRTISPDDVPGLQYLLCGGEPVDPEAFKSWGRARHLFNCWGPCEASVIATAAELRPDSPYPESIGTAINCVTWIMNPNNTVELTPIGAVGELVLEGPGVARGYLNDAVKTKAAFIPQPPWAPTRDKKAKHFYRTGDLARFNPDGSICFVGRRDNQVKLRGQRFELGELESVIAGCSEVRDASTMTKICGGRTELVCVASLTDPQLPNERELQDVSFSHPEPTVKRLCAVRDHVRSRLPSYMIPTIWLAVERMPLSTSTKLDRAAISEWLKTKNLMLAKAALDRHTTVSLTPPVTAREILLQTIWSSVLEISKECIGRESSFIQSGGDSILAMQAATRCHKIGIQIAIATLLGNKSLATIAESSLSVEFVAGVPMPSGAAPWDDIPGFLHTRLSQLSLSNAHFCKENLQSIAIATDVQAAMFAAGQSGVKGYRAFLGNFRLEFISMLNTARLRAACELVVQHHPILRTVFLQHGSVFYQIILKVPPTESVVEEIDQSTQASTFSKGTALARFHLFSDGQHCHHLHLEIHHSLYDAVSLGLIFRDLDAAYIGKPLSDGPHFHTWLWNIKALDEIASRQFWTEELNGSSMTHVAPPPVGPTRGHSVDGCIKIRVPLRNMKSPFGRPSSVMKAAWAFVLSHAVGINDVVFGEVSANRYLTMQGVEHVRGPCINFLPVRAQLEQKMTLATLVKQMQDRAMASLPHQHIGFRSIIKDCTIWPRWTRFSTTLVYQSQGFMGDFLKIGGVDGTLVSDGDAGDSTDLMLVATPHSEDLEIKFIFSPKTLPSKQIHWISQTLVTVIHAIPFILEQNLAQIGDSLQRSALGSYVVPPSLSSKLLNEHLEPPSENARETVLQAWKEIGLLPADHSEDRSMFYCGADIVTALLLSEYYRSCGYDINTEDIVKHPCRLKQALLVDFKARKLLHTLLDKNRI